MNIFSFIFEKNQTWFKNTKISFRQLYWRYQKEGTGAFFFLKKKKSKVFSEQ